MSAVPTHEHDATADLEVARELARAGVPIFVARADATKDLGFALPRRWQWTRPDPAAVDTWCPGDALCAVMGVKLDLLDVDPRNGGEETLAGLQAAGIWPRVVAKARTPSGGYHFFVAPMGTGSRDDVKAGFDVKGGKLGGRIDEAGRGFAFIAPTVKASKVTGAFTPYTWEDVPTAEAIEGLELDDAGREIARLVLEAKASTKAAAPSPSPVATADEGPIPEGSRYPTLRTYAGRLRAKGLDYGEAEPLFRRQWERCAQPPSASYLWSYEEARGAVLDDIWKRYAAGPVDVVGETLAALPDPAPRPATAPRGGQVIPFPGGHGEEDPGGRVVRLKPASAFELKRVRWLWDGRIASGTISLVAGKEGKGKSTACYWLAARITRGELPGDFFGTPRAVLVCATEDSWSHTIVPRLIAAGADLERVYAVEVVNELGWEVGLTLPRDIAATLDVALQVDAAMMLLDPLMSRLGAALDSHKDAEVRVALEPLARMADASGMAVVGLIHLNKSGKTDPLDMVMGSKAFTAVARSVSIVVDDPDDESARRRLLATPKNNLGPADLSLLPFTIQTALLDLQDGEEPLKTSRIVWDEPVSGESILDVFERSEGDGARRTATTEAGEWLEDYLAAHAGESDRKDIVKAGRAEGHSEDCVKRAQAKHRDRIGIRSEGYPRHTVWFLKDADGRGRHGHTDGPGSSQRAPDSVALTGATVSATSVSAPPRGDSPTASTTLTNSDLGKREDSQSMIATVSAVSADGACPPARPRDPALTVPSGLFPAGDGDSCPCGLGAHPKAAWITCGQCGRPWHRFGRGALSSCPHCAPKEIS